ncbi:DUF58 domain-containing protein [Georgenia thermotolerans]|uniref:DUF58 domain-containing protein n=1 Tax=Georgenia thermotolerans TaxID=527326 RepID=A0A7J5UL61_9MICO|nr:DUF58 domain-containing protein [Georgenia thermotolerans]KAE8763109.1 DUF58 domain-containing protein [Georgenia thermotolerans]
MSGLLRPAGWTVLALGVAATAAGWVLGWLELAALGAALLAVLAAALTFTVGRQPYAVDLRLSAHRVVVGERALGAVVVRNTAARAALPARLELPVGAAEAAFALPVLPAGGEHEEVVAIPTARRAVIDVGPVRSVRGDPFGLLRRAVPWTDVHELYVHPRTVRLAARAAGLLHDLEGRPTREVTTSDLSFHALREYLPGDDRRHVHWRSSARTGTLMVRQYEESRRTHLVLALSGDARDYAGAEEVEVAVSAAASLALQAFAEDADLTALTSGGALPVAAPRPLLDALTRLQAAPGTGGVAALARAAAQVERASLVVLVCGSIVPVRDLRAAGAVLPVGVRAVAVRVLTDAPERPEAEGALAPDSSAAHRTAEESGRADVRRVGAVTVVTVAALEDLPRALRAAAR